MDICLRPLVSDDEPFLWEALYHALYVPPGGTPFPANFVAGLNSRATSNGRVSTPMTLASSHSLAENRSAQRGFVAGQESTEATAS